jgi:hypothetical protein
MLDRPQQERTKQRVAAPSSELARLLELVREIPETARPLAATFCEVTVLDRVPPAWEGIKRLHRLQILGLSNEIEAQNARQQWFNRFDVEISKLSSRLRAYISQPHKIPEVWSFLREVEVGYNKILGARRVLLFAGDQNTAAIRSCAATNLLTPSRGPNRYRLALKAYWESMPQRRELFVKEGLVVTWGINSRNELKFAIDPHIEGLEGVDYFRIRKCARCGTIFFAGRLQQTACPEPCAHILRTLRWRAAYQEKYKQQRIKKVDAEGSAAKGRKPSGGNSKKGGR